MATNDSGAMGTIAPGGGERMITQHEGDTTVVRAVAEDDGRLLRKRTIDGAWAIPAVTINGGTTGLSADGSTLILAQPYSEKTFPPHGTRLAVLDARTLRPTKEIALKGFFTVDAISPDGKTAFVVQYENENFLDYRVRALDTSTGRLDPRDVVDPREPEEQMGGVPFTRETTADGRWVYTLYGGGEETFIHALDTVGRTAACIDLEMIPPTDDLSDIKLLLSGGETRIDVEERGMLRAQVNTRTFAVSEPREAAAQATPTRTAAPQPAPPSEEGRAWRALAVAAGAIGLAALVLLLTRRRAGRMLARRTA
jgi:hypothetical protein